MARACRDNPAHKCSAALINDIAYLDRNGNFVQDTLRISDSALVWQHDGVVLRIESALLGSLPPWLRGALPRERVVPE